MWTNDLTYHDLVSAALGDKANLQAFIDDVFAKKYNTAQLDGFPFNPEMQVDFNYEQLQAELGLNVMATYVDIDSPGTPISFDKLSLSTGKIPRMKKRAEYDESEMRKIMILQQRFGALNNRAINASMQALFNVTDKLIGAHANSMTYQRHQMVSKAQLALTATNNPAGVNLTLSAKVPDGNKVTKTTTARWWTDAYLTEGAASDPIADLRALVAAIKAKFVVNFHLEINKTTLEKTLQHSSVRTKIGYYIQPLAGSDTIAGTIFGNLSYEAQKLALENLIGARIVAIDSVVAVEKWDNDKKELVQSQIQAFEEYVVVAVPDGNLGDIKTVEPIKLPVGNEFYAEYYGGRLLMTVDFNVMNKIQYFATEMTSLVVPDKPNLMFYLTVK